MATKHAPGLGEFAVCGLAFDAHDSGAVDAPVEFAAAQEKVTCADCRRVIDHVRQNFTLTYRYKPKS